MNYIKNLIKILVIAQCFLFYACDKKEVAIEGTSEVVTEVITTEQKELNLVDFVRFPFNEEFKINTNLEKYVLKKLGKPDEVTKGRDSLNDTDGADMVVYRIWLEYSERRSGDKFSFTICRGVSKKFEVFEKIYIERFIDLKYGINEKTTMRDIENLFGSPALEGRPEEVQNLQRKGSDVYSYTGYYSYLYSPDGPYVYHLNFGFSEGKLDSIKIKVNISASGL